MGDFGREPLRAAAHGRQLRPRDAARRAAGVAAGAGRAAGQAGRPKPRRPQRARAAGLPRRQRRRPRRRRRRRGGRRRLPTVASAAASRAGVGGAAPAAPEPAASRPGGRRRRPARASAGDAPALRLAAVDPRHLPARPATTAARCSGDAQVEWIRAGTRYQVHVDLSVGPRVAPLVQRRMSSEGELGATQLLPEPLRRGDEGGVPRHAGTSTVLLGADEIVLADGKRQPRVDGVQDSRQPVHPAGGAVRAAARAAAGRRRGRDDRSPCRAASTSGSTTCSARRRCATPFGAARGLAPASRAREPRRPGELVAEIWFAPGLRYLPVRIRIEQDAETYIDLMIARRPELAPERRLRRSPGAAAARLLSLQPARRHQPDGLRTHPRSKRAATVARKTGLITLNRPKQLNALNDALMDELGRALLGLRRRRRRSARS